jgi:hypothetical protein
MDNLENIIMIHFPMGEFTCEDCADFGPGVCEGKGYNSEMECVKCMEEKIQDGEYVMMFGDY